jgi:hypothetical protein
MGVVYDKSIDTSNGALRALNPVVELRRFDVLQHHPQCWTSPGRH